MTLQISPSNSSKGNSGKGLFNTFHYIYPTETTPYVKDSLRHIYHICTWYIELLLLVKKNNSKITGGHPGFSFHAKIYISILLQRHATYH